MPRCTIASSTRAQPERIGAAIGRRAGGARSSRGLVLYKNYSRLRRGGQVAALVQERG